MITGYAHIGIRVHDLAKSQAFYELLGFTKTLGPVGPESVVIMDHPAGMELNLIVNAHVGGEPNVLMDVPVKAPGITHIALLCPDLEAAIARLAAAGITPSGGPVTFHGGARAYFVRDPDRTVIELHQPPAR
jgi:lactoylglutathione lyase